MLRLLLLSLCCWSVSRAYQDSSHSAFHRGDATRPYIHYCRSPSMETFTCWWHPLGNGSLSNDNVTYKLLYRIGIGSPKECPDYVSGGANSCYFDTAHTVIWEVYCMNVTAHGRKGSIVSEEHCVDVADIVEIDPPFNLTYTLMNSSDDESGRTALVSWLYPIVQEVNIGWITLIYELRYRSTSEPNNWKVKEHLREPHLELLDLPVGSYEVQVRCRSKNNHLWSKWSSPQTIIIPARRLPERMLYGLILLTGVGVMTLLIIGFGVIPQGKRIKAFLLPPIPKPRIRGIDPMLLKKGKMDEINRHFSALRGYRPPDYCGKAWYQVNMDEGLSVSSLPPNPPEKLITPPPGLQNAPHPESQQLLRTPDGPAPYCQGPAPCGKGPTYFREETSDLSVPLSFPFTESGSWAWPEQSPPAHPELVSFPGMDYSMILNPAPLSSAPQPAPPQDFYTCVNGVTPGGAVHLVPCVSTNNPLKDEGSDKSAQLAAYLDKQVELSTNWDTLDLEEAEGKLELEPELEPELAEFAVPLLTRMSERN